MLQALPTTSELLLCDWDANHVDDAVEGAAVGMAAGAALAIVAPPVGAVAGIRGAFLGERVE